MKLTRIVICLITLILVLATALCSCAELDNILGNSANQNTEQEDDKTANNTDKPSTDDNNSIDSPNTNDNCAHYVTSVINKKDASCTEEGYTGDKMCYSCGELAELGKNIDKIPHTFDSGKCKICGEEDPNYKPPVIIGADKFDYSEVPEYSGDNYVVINGNIPYFTDEEITNQSFEYYGDLDELGRCTIAYASLGVDLFPTGTRPSLSFKPTGWVQNTYPSNIVPQTNIYNRSHLIAWALSGEGNNEKNLMTGTPYFNQIGMQIFENQILDYIRETSNHVMYRVTPIFVGDNLLANGALMEAWSVEDGGDGICFNVFMYNVQPGIDIDYATGDNSVANTGDNTETGITATLVTDISQLTNGSKIVIVAKNQEYALGSQNTNNRVAAIITKDGNTVNVSSDVQIITLSNGITNGTYSLSVDGGYLYAASSQKNQLKTEASLSTNGSWTIEISSDGVATIKSTGANTRNWLRFNPQNCLFSTYASGQTDICIYVLNDN